jgi:dihydrofolate reductase
MAKLVYGLMQSLDGYVDHLKLGPPLPALARHLNEQMRRQAGCVYGRGTYEIMRYWEEDRADWDEEDHEFAAMWRRQPKWVVSRSLESVGLNATLLDADIAALIGRLKAELAGEIAAAGPMLAGSLTGLGLIDEYRLYFPPFVPGCGTPFFAGARPPLRLVASDRMGEDAFRLTYVPA